MDWSLPFAALRRVLDLESAKGFNDAAVLGGLDRFLANWATQAARRGGPEMIKDLQRLHLLNSSHVRLKLERSRKLRLLLAIANRDPRRAVNGLYLTVLSRFPTADELRGVQEYTRTSKLGGPRSLVDVTWALVNSTEFLYRH